MKTNIEAKTIDKTYIEDLSQTRKKVSITFQPKELGEVSNHVIKTIAQYAKIPGFRAGKAPIDMIKRQHNKTFLEELRKELVSKAFEAVKQAVPIVSLVKVENFSIDEAQPTTIEVVVDTFPEFTLPNYKGLSVNSLPTAATDEDISKAIDQLQKERAKYTVVERPAKPSDFVKLSYTGTIDEQLVKDITDVPAIFGTQKNTWEEVASTRGPHIPAIAEGIVDMQAKDTKTVTETFPEDFPVKPLAGKAVSYAIEVHEVRERELPPLDETFFNALGVKSLEELQEKMTEHIAQQKDYENHVHQRQQITDILLQIPPFPLPESLVQSEITHVLQDMVENAAQRGMNQAQMEEHKKAFFDRAKDVANNNTRLYLILEKIAKAEKMTVSNEDLQMALYQEAKMKRMKPDELIKEIRQDSDRLQRLKQKALYSKALDFIQNEIQTLTPTP